VAPFSDLLKQVRVVLLEDVHEALCARPVPAYPHHLCLVHEVQRLESLLQRADVVSTIAKAQR